MPQLDLFPAPPLDTRADAALAARRPSVLRIGTSSWTFPGWGGLVYRGKPSTAELVEWGLEEYSRHPLFNTVGIDRSHYAPLSIDELNRYARQLPAGFKCVTKVWNAVTSPVDARTRLPNPHFLDARFFRDAVLVPSDAAFLDHQGPFVFQMLPLSSNELPDPEGFIARLERFFAQLPKHHQYAIEIRNPELLKPSYFAALARHDVAHVDRDRLRHGLVARGVASRAGQGQLSAGDGQLREGDRELFGPRRLRRTDRPRRRG